MRKRELFVIAVGLCLTASVSFAGTAPKSTDSAPLMGPTVAPQIEGGVMTGGGEFAEDWEGFNEGEEPCGTNGWEEWTGSTDVCGHINQVFSNSGVNSLQIVGAVGGRTGLGDDTVQVFSIDDGVWTMSIMTYIRSNATGTGWVIMQNRYPANINWSVQVRWETASGNVVADFDLESTQIIFDEWIEFRVEIDLGADTVDYFYDDFQFIDDKSWREGVSGGGDATIQCLDLYGGEPGQGGVTAIYFDDVDMSGGVAEGACCLPDGSCTDGVPRPECNGLGGRFAADTLCEEIEPPCLEQTGGCCIEAGGGCTRDPEWQCDGDTDGSGEVNPVDLGLVQANYCDLEGEDACTAEQLCQYDMDCDGKINPVDGGLVQALFGICDPPPDACGDGGEGRCEVLTGTDCKDVGGDFLGFGSDCEDDVCGFALGACCVELNCAGTMRNAACDDIGGRWHVEEDCDAGFECPDRSGCEWDNSMIPDGFSGRAISPPGFPNIRVVDDIVTDGGGCIVQNFHANVIEDAGWTEDGMITVTVYSDTGSGPGGVVDSVTTGYTRMATGDNYFGRDDFDYWVEGLSLDLDPGTYWIGLRNEGGGGAGSNYWMTSDGGFDGGGTDTGWFSLDGGNSWSPEGAGWQHAFEILP